MCANCVLEPSCGGHVCTCTPYRYVFVYMGRPTEGSVCVCAHVRVRLCVTQHV